MGSWGVSLSLSKAARKGLPTMVRQAHHDSRPQFNQSLITYLGLLNKLTNNL
jgi:hypothetical protein